MECTQCKNAKICGIINNMPRFFFTYGTDEAYPYQGGWSEVYAQNMDEAVAKFISRHGSRYPDSKIVNCASIYDEKEFVNSSMFVNGNFGQSCQEVII